MKSVFLFTIAVCVLSLSAIALGVRHQPVAPRAGSYSWRAVLPGKVPTNNNYVGGRICFDFVSGYVRLESWISLGSKPSINGISLWNLRGATPTMNFISPSATCKSHVLDLDADSAPLPEDYTGYTFDSLSYSWNRALAEKWIDTDGNYLYLDAFTRDIIGMGRVANKSDSDDQDVDYQISDWSTDAPDVDLFLVPSSVQCTPVTPIVPVVSKERFLGIGKKKKKEKCKACTQGMQNVKDLACGRPGGPPPSAESKEAACKKYMPTFDMCAFVMGNACDEGLLNPGTICKQQGDC